MLSARQKLLVLQSTEVYGGLQKNLAWNWNFGSSPFYREVHIDETTASDKRSVYLRFKRRSTRKSRILVYTEKCMSTTFGFDLIES